MKLIHTLSIASLLSLSVGPRAQAQDLQWLHSEPVGWTLNYQMPNHQVRASHNGQVSATRGLGPGFSFGVDIFSSIAVDRVDPLSGVPTATCQMGDSLVVESMVVADDGTTYVAGRFIGTLEFGGGSTLAGAPGFLVDHLFLAAFAPNDLSLLWARDLSLDHPDAYHVPALEIDANGTVWYGLEQYSVIHLISLGALGVDEQDIPFNGTRSLGGFAFDPWNNVYVTGSCEDILGPLSFGGLSVPQTETYGLFVLRMRANGAGHWAAIAHAETFHDPDIVVDPSGNAFVSSAIMSATALGNVQFHGPNWLNDVILAKVDSTGDFLWGVESAPAGGAILGDMSQSRMMGLACDGAGNIHFTGTARGETDWGNGVTTTVLTLGAYAQTIVSFSGDGTPQWAMTSEPSALNAQSIACDDAGAIYFTGHANGSFGMNGSMVNTGGGQAFIDGRIDGLSTAVRTDASSLVLRAWPTPAQDQVCVSVPASQRGTYMLFASSGRIVQQGALQPGVNTIALAHLPAGIYVLRTAAGEAIRITKN